MGYMEKSRNRLEGIKLVSFDIWKTLLDSNPEYKNQRNETLRRHLTTGGISPEEMAQIAKTADDAVDDQSRRDGQQYGVRAHVEAVYQMIPAGNRVMGLTDEVFSSFDRDATELIAQHLPKIVEPDLLTTLRRLKDRGIEMAVISNTGFIDGRYMRIVLEKLGILPFLKVQIFSNEVGLSKPSVEIFKALLTQAGFEAAEVLHIGDDLIADYQGAVEAGLNAVHLTSKGDDDTRQVPALRSLVS